uniref:Latent-transforming growth factor beta-binding protein 1 n=1 Tax=Sphenodon punctatus TaxID=8508 RepID=A0A8D0HNQ8_SPHPU
MRGSWGNLFSLIIALFLGVGDCQRDFGRFDSSSSFRTETGSRDATRRLRNQGSNLGSTGKVFSLFRVHSPPSALEQVPAAPQTAPTWMRSQTRGENRRQTSVPADHKLPASQNARVQASNPRAFADSAAGSLGQTPQQRQRIDSSSRPQPRNGLKSRTVPRAKPQVARGRMVGPNVCGGHCCSGWTTAPGTNRCIKPVCDPPCQNKGSCSRPQLCICRSGFHGSRCEEVVPEREYHPPGRAVGEGGACGLTLCRVAPPLPDSPTQGRIGSPIPSQQHTGPSRTVRRYPAANNGQLTSNALPNGNGHEQSNPGPHTAYQDPALSPWGVNLTEKIRKIKIIFTPTVCKQTCQSGRCYNNCEKGDTTTLYSQGGHNHDPKSGFRIYFCQIPCLNGGRCVGRDECWCPSNSTGKFCHLPTPKLGKKQLGRATGSSMQHSMYTLPLSNQLASLNPSLVNVHINHPPEATVQIHQVARVRSDSDQSEENSVEAVLRSQLLTGTHYSDSNRNGNSIATESSWEQRPQGLVGRCFLEAVHGQCTNPLAGLAKFEDCCGSVGVFWGVNKCIPCPPKPAHPVVENGQVECPQGYKRLNQSHCQDINECLILGLCKAAECVNTRGSFLCTCKSGTMLDPSRSRCISDKAVSMEQGLCYRSVAEGVCALPLAQRITKQICCCSRVGKGWGKSCERCPLPGSEAFKEICPAGHGYTYSSADIRLSMRKAEAEEILLSSEEQGESSDRTPSWTARRQQLQEVISGGITDTLPRVGTSAEEGGITNYTQMLTWHAVKVGNASVLEKGKQGPFCLADCNIFLTDCLIEIDICITVPSTCGPGACVTLPGGYSCLCDPGYRLHTSHTYCIDNNECTSDPCAQKGRCMNSEGSYSCLCYSGYILITSQGLQTCQDLNECDQPNICHGGRCTNTPGSYHCECDMGYVMSQRGQCEDIDECANPNTCTQGRCVNTPGSYECLSCADGYRPMNGRCVDDNECLALGTCAHGLCINLEGSFRCSCYHGYKVTADGKSCQDIDECISPLTCPMGICANTDGSFTCQVCEAGYMLSSHRLTCEDIDECEDPNGGCLGGECLNTLGSYMCRCQPGFELLNGTVCEEQQLGYDLLAIVCPSSLPRPMHSDVDECADQSRCLRGQCLNTVGSYRCLCGNGFKHSQETDDCVDIDECANETLCGSHGFCDNTDGSFLCLCDLGYEVSPSGQDCVDVNECELMVAVCGTALCENVEGAFLCLCPSDNEEYDTEAAECRPRAGMENPERSIAPHLAIFMRKECYYHISDVQLCDSVLAKNSTKEECCCTEGAAWGDNCETHPCPVVVEYSEICPSGKGYIPVEGTLLFGQTSYTDADECEMFGSEVCRNGQCVNTVPGYTCFCRSGYLYDSSRLECVDRDECQNDKVCVNGECLNTAGSFHCFCSLPLVLDVTRNRCVNISNSAGEQDVDEHEIHLDICWQRVSNYICNEPLHGRRTTYTECCCRYGEAWSQNCALCPPRTSEDFSQLCNVARGEAELQERPGYEYGPGLEEPLYGLYNPDLGPYYNYLGPDLPHPTSCPHQADAPCLPSGHYDSFEGLRAEECGILNGCDNGRCVRVQEGYTCDCFDGFQLDMTRMACVDINECEEANAPGSLCEGGTCENTEGSYRCNCLPGYVALADHHCVPEITQSPEAARL